MDCFEYLVGDTLPGDKFVSIAHFKDLEDAFIFIKAYMDKYHLEPNLHLTIMRVDRSKVVE